MHDDRAGGRFRKFEFKFEFIISYPMYGCLFDSHVGISRGGGCSLVKTDFYASMLIGETGFRSTAFTLDVKSPFSHSLTSKY